MSKIIANRDDIEAIADEIRILSKINHKMNLEEMKSALSKVSVNGIELPTLNNIGDASDLLLGKQLINQYGDIVTGTIPSQTAQTITPTTSNQIIESGVYLSGTQTILGDANLISDNIKSGVSIFGVDGAYEGNGSGILQEKIISPATSSQTITADDGYDGLSKVTINAMPITTQAIPNISIDSNGLITASVTQIGGYIPDGITSATKQLTTKGATTITPTTLNQTIESGIYLSGVQTVLGDANLISDNIKSGVSIFGINGSYEGVNNGSNELILQEKIVSPTTFSQTITADNGYDGLSEVTIDAIPSEYIITTDATATADEIFNNESAYVNGEKVIGTFTIEEEIATQDNLIDELRNVLSELSEKNISGDSSFVDSELPSGYIKVDYIKFTGEQAIDSKIVCNKDTKIKVLFTRDNSSSQYLYGVASSNNTASVTAYLSTTGAWRFGDKYINRAISTNENIIRTAIVSSNNIVSESGTSSYASVSNFETIGSLYIGSCRMTDGSISDNKFIGKIFSYEIWQGDTLVFKIVPVVNADGVYRFWDVVSKDFATTLTEVAFMGGNL